MTDSVAPTRAGKRARLVASAGELFHQNGVDRTTLADIAQSADVPVGNVYYYFKAKDDIVRAVIDAQAEQIRTRLRSVEQHPSPRARLVALTRMFAQDAESAANHGCRHGGLCAQLDKRHDGIDKEASILMSIQIDWVREQFRQLGRADAHDLAVELVGAYQGASLLANALQDPSVVTGRARTLERWLDTVGDEQEAPARRR